MREWVSGCRPWALLLALSVGCSFGPKAARVLPADAGPLCQFAPQATLDQIFPPYLSDSSPASCASAGCHGSGAGGLKFQTARDLWTATYQVPSADDPGMFLVSPGDPEHSYLYRKVLHGASDPMPPGGPYLNPYSLSQVIGWICGGALPPSTTGFDAGTCTGFSLCSVSPNTVNAGSGQVVLSLTGSGFIPSSVADLDGYTLPTTAPNAVLISAVIDPVITQTGGNHAILVSNGYAATSSLPFTVLNPQPRLTAISPSQVATGGAPFALVLSGSGFNPGSRVTTPGFPGDGGMTATFVSPTQLVVQLPPLPDSGSFPFTVSNAPPGGGTSAAVSLSVIDTTNPTVTGLSPDPGPANAAFALQVTGSGYVCSGAPSVVLWDGGSLSPSACTSTQLTVGFPAADAGSYALEVNNPGTGVTSNPLTLTLQPANPVPTLASLSPSVENTGIAGVTVTATGTNFVPGATLMLNGSPRLTRWYSNTQVTAGLPASDFGAAGSPMISVVNPTPGGGASNALALTINQTNPFPLISALMPCGLVAGDGGFTLTIDGMGLGSFSTVSFSGRTVPVTSSSATQLQVAIPSSAVAVAPADGELAVTVTNPAPGGGTSPVVGFGLASQVSTLSANVQPILSTSCAISGCHVSASANVPMDLSAGVSYANLVNATCSECPPRLRVQACGPLPTQSYLMAKLTQTDICLGNPMPPGAPLSAAQIRLVQDWIAQGTPP